jgi:hypothetical protein
MYPTSFQNASRFLTKGEDERGKDPRSTTAIQVMWRRAMLARAQRYTEGHPRVGRRQHCQAGTAHGHRQQALSSAEFLDTGGKHSRNKTSSALS